VISQITIRLKIGGTMKKRKIRTELHVPYGYEFEDLYDTEVPEELGEPILEEEVTVSFGRSNQTS
jgi:hypothetical protein